MSIKCHDGLPGTPASHTTEDPLSPPCVAWDPSGGNGGATSRGVYTDHIDVAMLGMDPAEDDYINSPASPASDVCNQTTSGGGTFCYGRNVRILRQFFLTHFQTYGRSVIFHGWRQPYPYSLHGRSLADAIVASLHPFALIYTPSLYCCYTPDDAVAFAQDHIETFSFNDIAVDRGLLDGSVVRAASPYLWTVDPTIDQIIDEGVAWVCDTLLPNPVAVSNDPRENGAPRKIALGYQTYPGTAGDAFAPATTQKAISRGLADRFAAAADARCGHGHHVFDQFNCDATAANCDQAIWFQDNGGSPDPSVSETALATMHGHGDTSILCALCGGPSGITGMTNGYVQTEASLQYFPELLFVSGGAIDPYYARNSDTAEVRNMTGLSELWQLPGYTQTYWFRAYNQTDPSSTISQLQGFDLYQLLMHLFSAIQLAGPDLNATGVALGGPSPGQVGLCRLRRAFTDDPAATLLPPASPAAGHSCTIDGSSVAVTSGFLRGMSEQRWDPAGVPPGGEYPSIYENSQGGCYRVIDPQLRHSTSGWPGTTPWPRQDDSAQLLAPCTGDYGGIGGIA